MPNLIYTMTDEVAFRLGKADWPSFYQYARWRINEEPFELAHFFTWWLPSGHPLGKNAAGEWESKWTGLSLEGKLKTSEIVTPHHKHLYVRGRLTSYSVQIKDDSLYVGWANSYDLRDFFAECLQETLMHQYVYNRSFTSTSPAVPKWSIHKGETVGTIPGTPYIEMKADKAVIQFVVGDLANPYEGLVEAHPMPAI